MWCMKISRFMIAIATGLAVVSCSSQMEAPTSEVTELASKAEDDGKKEQKSDKERKQKDAEQTDADKSQTDDSEVVAPTEEQQAAAEKMLIEGDSSAETGESLDVLPEPIGNEEVLDDHVPNASGIPGRNALRMGQYAPPEEAASAGNARPPRPNRAEQYGFRSPSLPNKLPMDINGKLTGEGKN